MLYYCFSRVQPVAACFLQFCWIATYSRCYRLPKSCKKLSSALACWVHSSGEMKLTVLHSSCWAVFCDHVLVHAWPVLITRLITANICWDSTRKIFHQYCPLTRQRQLPLLLQRSTNSTSQQTWKMMSVAVSFFETHCICAVIVDWQKLLSINDVGRSTDFGVRKHSTQCHISYGHHSRVWDRPSR